MRQRPELWKQIPSCWFDFQDIYDEAVETAPANSILVECGSFWGQSTVYLAESAKLADKGLKVYCVDTWGMTPANNPPMFDKAQIPQHIEPSVHAQYHDSVFETFAHFVDATGLSPDPLRILRMSSIEAALLFKESEWVKRNPIHFVFLDDDHDYPYVKREIAVWDELIKESGFIAGHDWTNEFSGVERSVRAYMEERRGQFKNDVYDLIVSNRSWTLKWKE